MNFQHQKLASGRWRRLSFFDQMANIGSEVERAISWRNKDNDLYSRKAAERALELLFLTIGDLKNRNRLKELTRLHEVLVDYFLAKINILHRTASGKSTFMFLIMRLGRQAFECPPQRPLIS